MGMWKTSRSICLATGSKFFSPKADQGFDSELIELEQTFCIRLSAAIDAWRDFRHMGKIFLSLNDVVFECIDASEYIVVQGIEIAVERTVEVSPSRG